MPVSAEILLLLFSIIKQNTNILTKTCTDYLQKYIQKITNIAQVFFAKLTLF